MIGTIIEKENFDAELYAKCAEYCNSHSEEAGIEDKGDYYEVIPIKKEEVVKSIEEQIKKLDKEYSAKAERKKQELIEAVVIYKDDSLEEQRRKELNEIINEYDSKRGELTE